MFTRTYYLEFQRFKSKEKSKKMIGHSNLVIIIPFWVTTLQMVIDSTRDVEETNSCYAYLKRIERIK